MNTLAETNAGIGAAVAERAAALLNHDPWAV